MKMLAACGSQRMELGELATKGEVGYAAFRSAGEIQVLLFRQKMKNDDLAPKERVALKVELDAAPGAVTVERIDESHGNPLRVWQEEYGSRNDLNREEVEGIIEKSKVEAVCWQYTFCKGVLETEVELGINDVCCVHIPC
jgi:xylan 1,4-beta-xylosidase